MDRSEKWREDNMCGHLAQEEGSISTWKAITKYLIMQKGSSVTKHVIITE